MRYLSIAVVALLFALTGSVAAQEDRCVAQTRTANAMLEELQQQVRIMSTRAARYFAEVRTLQGLLAKAEATAREKEQGDRP